MRNMVFHGSSLRDALRGVPRWKRLTGRCLLAVSVILGSATVPGAARAQRMWALGEEHTGSVVAFDGTEPVLRYNHGTVLPEEEYLAGLAPGSRKYARPRSNYIHPLYGPGGEALTEDWAHDHPHPRGIYWAWPEVQYGGEMGDLHSLQRVFARPTGKIEVHNGAEFAEIKAENRWLWEDETPIVHEEVTIRAWLADKQGRNVDLRFEFVALEDGITLARRGTDKYGGLNIRLAPVEGLEIRRHADPPDRSPRLAWQLASGTWRGAKAPATLVVFEDADNPHYPADFIQYPNLPWFQPAFPKAGVRYELSKTEPLVLRYRLSIQPGGMRSEQTYARQWQAWQETPQP